MKEGRKEINVCDNLEVVFNFLLLNDAVGDKAR